MKSLTSWNCSKCFWNFWRKDDLDRKDVKAPWIVTPKSCPCLWWLVCLRKKRHNFTALKTMNALSKCCLDSTKIIFERSNFLKFRTFALTSSIPPHSYIQFYPPADWSLNQVGSSCGRSVKRKTDPERKNNGTEPAERIEILSSLRPSDHQQKYRRKIFQKSILIYSIQQKYTAPLPRRSEPRQKSRRQSDHEVDFRMATQRHNRQHHITGPTFKLTNWWSWRVNFSWNFSVVPS